MHTRVEVRAAAAAAGRTALVVLRASGALAARATGPVGGSGAGADAAARVHLVGTAAGPLGGDTVEVRVVVEAGAALVLRGVAATLALPSREPAPARVHVHLDVAEGGRCDVALQPVVVARGADLHVVTEVVLQRGAVLDLTEEVLLGRWGEAPGRWRGTLRADVGGRPWVRQSVALGPGAPAWDALDAPRALRSRLRSPAAHAAAGTGGGVGRESGAVAVRGAALLPLALGGTLLESLGADLTSARADAAAVEERRHASAAAGPVVSPGA